MTLKMWGGSRLQHHRHLAGRGCVEQDGILLPPAAAAVLMSVSTAIVAINAQLLRRVRL